MDSTAWAPVVAAIGSSALTAAVAYGIEWRRTRRDSASARTDRQQAAYSELLTRCALLVNSAGALRLTVTVRSGLKEGLDVVTGLRRPVDPLELNEYIRRDMEPLFAAMTEVWVVGSQRAIEAANDLVDQATTVVGAATDSSGTRPSLARFLSGVKWSDADNQVLADEIRKLASIRTAFAGIARSEAGVEPARFVTARGDLASDTGD